MTLNLSDPKGESNFMKWVDYTLEVCRQLQEKGIEPTIVRVTNILSIIDEKISILSWDAQEVIELALLLWIWWMKEGEISLKTKEDFLQELEFLNENSDDISKRRINNFRESLCPDLDLTSFVETMFRDHWRQSWEYFGTWNGWSKGIGNDLYEAIKKYIIEKDWD